MARCHATRGGRTSMAEGGVPEGSMQTGKITLTAHLEPDGVESVTTTRSEGMSYKEALGILEFAKMCLIQSFIEGRIE